MKSIIKKYKESHTVQNKPGRDRRQKILNTLEIKLLRDVCKDARTTAKTLVNDLDRLGIVVSMETCTGMYSVQENLDFFRRDAFKSY